MEAEKRGATVEQGAHRQAWKLPRQVTSPAGFSYIAGPCYLRRGLLRLGFRLEDAEMQVKGCTAHVFHQQNPRDSGAARPSR
jgi:hypothetical protein